MQQANTMNFPKSQPQHCRQEEKRTSWHCSTSSPQTSQFLMQPKQRDSRNSIIKLTSSKLTKSCPGTAAAGMRSTKSSQCCRTRLESLAVLNGGVTHGDASQGCRLGTAHAPAVTGLQRGGGKAKFTSLEKQHSPALVQCAS